VHSLHFTQKIIKNNVAITDDRYTASCGYSPRRCSVTGFLGFTNDEGEGREKELDLNFEDGVF
jgi:hypothetical protein